MNRRSFMHRLGVGAAAGWSAGMLGPGRRGAQAARGTAKRPNILLLVVDDLGYGDLANYGCPDGETPNFDKFFAEGVKFTNFYSNGAFCAPTRASLLTGLYPQHAGIWRAPGDPVKHATKQAERARERAEKRADRDNAAPLTAVAEEQDARGFPDDVVLLPRLLKNSGYRTAMFGKWHLGYVAPNTPNDRGFVHFMGFLPGASPYGPKHKTLQKNGKTYDEDGHLTEIFTNHAVEYIEQHDSAERFFLYLANNAPHGPIDNGASMIPEIVKKYADRGIAPLRANYLALIDHLDQNIGRVMEALRKKGIDEETVVVLFSDNGGQLRYEARNEPLRGGKGQTFEGGIRVPCAVRWPGVVPGSRITSARAAAMDFFPTILDFASVKAPEKNGGQAVSGVSLANLLVSGGQPPAPNRHLFFEHLGMVGVLHGPWKLVADIYEKRDKEEETTSVKQPKVFELYNVEMDIGETTDLASSHPEIVERLEEELLKWMRSFKRTQFTSEWKL